MRTGIIARKIGMTQRFGESGDQIPITVLKMDNVQVVAQRTREKDGYTAVQLGWGTAKVKNVSGPMRGHFSKAKVEPKLKLAEFSVTPDAMLEIGALLSPAHFSDGQFVDVTGISIGKGFAGSMKRHNFRGLRASHGVSVSHRSHGSTGQCQDPGKVFKGKKMAGHMGANRVTIKNLQIVSTDVEQGLILVRGAVPGSKGSFVRILDANKKRQTKDLPFPAGFVDNSTSGQTAAKTAEEEAEKPAENPTVNEKDSLKVQNEN